MMNEAYKMWSQIEKEGGAQLYMWVCIGIVVMTAESVTLDELLVLHVHILLMFWLI